MCKTGEDEESNEDVRRALEGARGQSRTEDIYLHLVLVLEIHLPRLLRGDRGWPKTEKEWQGKPEGRRKNYKPKKVLYGRYSAEAADAAYHGGVPDD